MLSLSFIADQSDIWQTQADHFSRLIVGSTILVAIGVALEGVEFIHDIWVWIKRTWAKRKERTAFREIAEFVPICEIHIQRRPVHPDAQPAWIKVVGHIGLLLVVVGVVGEWKYGAQFEDAQRHLIGAARDAANEAVASAKTAHEEADAVKGIADEARADAKDALGKAKAAQQELAAAESDSAKAEAVASKALSTSNQAESHLAVAVKRADELAEQLKRLKSSRSLTHIPALISALEPFHGTEYTFSGVFGDEESGELLRAIIGVLQRSGWKMVKPVHRFPMLTFSNEGEDLEVPSILSTGIQISVDSPESVDALSALPKEKLPPHIRAAIELNDGIFSNLFPPQEIGRTTVNVQTGTSMTVRISIGKKP